MKTKFIILIIIGLIISGCIAYVSYLMYDCMNPPSGMKGGHYSFDRCWGLFLNGYLPDYSDYRERYLDEPVPLTLKEMQANLDKTPREKTPLTAEEKNRNYLKGGLGYLINNSDLTKMCKETGQGNVWSMKYDSCINSTTPFGSPRDTTGNYDHCFSYKTDPEYGVEIQNSTHILNIENCEWE